MFRNVMCSTAIATIFSVTGVMADVTPEEVWANWQALSTSAGQELTVGGEARNVDAPNQFAGLPVLLAIGDEVFLDR